MLADRSNRRASGPPGSLRAVGEVLLHTVRIRSIVDSRSAAAIARRAARTVGLDSTAASSVAIAAGELATNVARHAKEGVIRVYAAETYVKVVAEDRGPGIADIESALRDGHSGGRQLGVDDPRDEGIGCGLGAVRRLMDRLEIQSTPGGGTCVIAVKRGVRSARA
jgi:anti-sigma regulatory factor (Ser/Thr protein kinase)